MKRALYVKRKGFNYYTDYTELYLHNAFHNYGYSIIRSREKSNFSVFVYISEKEKYMKIISPFFDTLDEGNILKLCEIFSVCFKCEVMASNLSDNMVFSGEKYEFLLSDTFSAYDEPIYLYNEPPLLKQRIGVINFKPNESNHFNFVNVGGSLSGIKIIFDFYENTDELELTDAQIHYLNNNQDIYMQINFIKDKDTYTANADFLTIEKGINTQSAVLRAKKKDTEERKHSFWLSVLPKTNANTTLKPTLTITSGNIIIFKSEI